MPLDLGDLPEVGEGSLDVGNRRSRVEWIGAGRLRPVLVVAEVADGVTRELMDMVESRYPEDSGYESRSWLPRDRSRGASLAGSVRDGASGQFRSHEGLMLEEERMLNSDLVD